MIILKAMQCRQNAKSGYLPLCVVFRGIIAVTGSPLSASRQVLPEQLILKCRLAVVIKIHFDDESLVRELSSDKFSTEISVELIRFVNIGGLAWAVIPCDVAALFTSLCIGRRENC